MHEYDKFQFKRVNPFQGLVIDPETWGQAHEYHRQALVRHEYFQHRPGILAGLTVRATDPPSNTLLIAPGAGVDSAGNFVVVPQEQVYQLELLKEGLIYLILQPRDIPTDLLPSGQEGEGQPTRMVDGFLIQERDTLPTEPYLELARIMVGSGQKSIRDSADFFHPQAGEIDQRSQLQANFSARDQIRIGYLVHGGDPKQAHMEGLYRFIEQANRVSPKQFQFSGTLSLNDARVTDTDIVYCSGTGTLKLEGADLLPSFVKNRKLLWADPCHILADEGHLNDFRNSFANLVKENGKTLTRPAWGHPLYRHPFVFGELPMGVSNSNTLLTDQGFLYTDQDLGCSWLGGWEDSPLERSTIRSLVELGINLSENIVI